MSATAQFLFVDGSAELVRVGSVRYRELLEDGHTPVGTIPESDGISDTLEAYLSGRLAEVTPGGHPLVSVFTTPGVGVSVEQYGETTTYLYQHLPTGRRIRYTLARVQPAVGGDIRQLRQVDLMERPITTADVDGLDASVTYTGTWSNVTQAACMGGSYRRTSVAGDYVEWTSPVADGLTLVAARLTNAAMYAVSIDGDPTAAALVPTAQELVDGGSLDAAALTANGGTLDPGHRVVDGYGTTAYDYRVPLASDLPATTHVVRLTHTGYERAGAGATEIRLYVDGFSYSLTGPEEVAQSLAPSGSVWEYALDLKIGGAVTWVGNGHGYDTMDAITLQVDGTTVDLLNGETRAGAEIVVTRTSTLSHPDAVNLGTVVTEYRLRADGLTISFAATFAADFTGATLQYPMMAVTSDATGFDRGRHAGMGADADLTAHDGTLHGDGRADSATLWRTSGGLAALVTVPEPARTFGSDPVDVYIQDRAGGTLAKVYFEHKPVDVPAGSVRRSQAVYRFAELANPDLLLAR